VTVRIPVTGVGSEAVIYPRPFDFHKADAGAHLEGRDVPLGSKRPVVTVLTHDLTGPSTLPEQSFLQKSREELFPGVSTRIGGK
jgi:hypothetical protein